MRAIVQPRCDIMIAFKNIACFTHTTYATAPEPVKNPSSMCDCKNTSRHGEAEGHRDQWPLKPVYADLGFWVVTKSLLV